MENICISTEKSPFCGKYLCKAAYYELDYSNADKYGYAPLGKEIPESFFQTKNVNYVNSKYYREA